MAGFDRHFGDAKLIGMALGLIAGYLIYDSTTHLPTALGVGMATAVLGILGGVAPDLDSHSSIPRQRARALGKVVLFILPIGAIVLMREPTVEIAQTVGETVGTTPNEQYILAGVAALGVIGFIAGDQVVDVLLPDNHRGVFHTTWFWAIVGGILAIAIYVNFGQISAAAPIETASGTRERASVFIGGGFFIGTLTHLARDMVS